VTRVRIPLARPDFDQRELDAVRRVLQSGWVVQGPEVEAFEAAIAQLHEARHCIVVSSGTAALHVVYLAAGIGPGDALFIPSFAWPSAANLAVLAGARPVFVDVLPGTYNIDPEDLQRRIEQCRRAGWGKPRAIVPVHEFGLAADMDAILSIASRHGLEVIEDAACALGAAYHGRPVGTLGRAGIFSFHPRKAITTGEGGAIVTNDDALADLCRVWRNHGQTMLDGRRDFVLAGLNYRMTEIQAAIGRVQLDKFPGILAHRKRLASQYLAALAGCPALRLPRDDAEHTWQTFMVVLEDRIDRQQVIDALGRNGIGAGPGAVAGPLGAVYRARFGCRPEDCPQAVRLDARGLALPLFAALTADDVAGSAAALRRARNGASSFRRRGFVIVALTAIPRQGYCRGCRHAWKAGPPSCFSWSASTTSTRGIR